MERIFPWVVPFLFVGMWQAISVLLAWVSGYFALVREFPPAADSIVDEFRFASGYLRWVHFKGALHVKYGLKGLHIGPNVIFRPWSSMDLPCVPWPEIQQIRQADGFFSQWFLGSKFLISRLDLRFTVYGEPGSTLAARLKAPGESPQQPSPLRPS